MKSMKFIPVLLAGMILCTGCVSRTERLDKDFGNSYRNMVENQIYNPDAASNPPVAPPMGVDGEKGDLVLKTYREDVGKPKSVEKDIRIQVSD